MKQSELSAIELHAPPKMVVYKYLGENFEKLLKKEISIFTAISEIMQLSQGLNNPAIVYGILTEAIREFEDDRV